MEVWVVINKDLNEFVYEKNEILEIFDDEAKADSFAKKIAKQNKSKYPDADVVVEKWSVS